MSDEEKLLEMFSETKSNSFTIKNIYGFDKEIGINYYTNNLNEPCIIYIVSNMIIIYNLKTLSYKYFCGHEINIKVCKIDGNEKILITADKESVFIWDLKCNGKSELTLLRILHEPFEEEAVNITTAGISSCGRYLILVSEIISENDKENKENKNENTKIKKNPKGCILQFWEWSYGNKECNESIILPQKYGSIRTITFSFNKNEETYFALTFKNIVLFGTIQQENAKIKIHTPINAHSRICNELNQTCYLENSPLTVSVSSKGRLIIWFDHKNLNNKNYYRMLQLRNCVINDIKSFDKYIVIADELGEIRFYNCDDNLLMYVYKNDIFKSVNILSICLVNEKYNIEDEELSNQIFVTDFTTEQNLFIVRKIFIVTESGNILFCDVSKNTSKTVLQTYSDFNVAGDVFKTRLWTVSCLANGYINIFNYKTNIRMAEHNLNQYYKTKPKPLITACKICPDELSIFVGMENGDLWILDILTAKPTNSWPLHITNKKIDLIVFNQINKQFCAIATSDFTLCLLEYKNNIWEVTCKYQYHCKPIVNIFFLHINHINYVITIGEDRMYIKYDMSLEHNPLLPILDVRLDQIPKICCAELFDSTILKFDTSRYGKVILIANDAYKFVFYDAFTAKTLFTYLGPVFESPINKIMYLPSTDDNSDSFLIVASMKTLAVALLPLDGNPYRYSGFKPQSDKIERLYLTCDDSLILHGHKNCGSYWWTINKKLIKENFLNNGDDLEPFCKLLPGGKSGWFFKEIQDYFIYLQLLIKEKQNNMEQFIVTDFLDISEISDFMRAIGYFPSEYEIKNFLSEVNDTKNIIENLEFDEKKISFSELIKLYINHRPVFGYPLDDIINSIKCIKLIKNNNIIINNNILSMNEILNILTENYEKIPKLQAMKYLKELLKPIKYQNNYQELTENEIEKEFNELEKDFTIFEFCNYLLGMDVLQSPDGNLSMTSYENSKIDLDRSECDVESDLDS